MNTNSIIGKINYQIHKLQGGTIETDLSPYYALTEQINTQAKQYESLTDEELRSMGQVIRKQANSGFKPEDLMIEMFALVREISWRLLKMRHYDVQLIAGIALQQGRIAELHTGEGKTLAAVLPVCLNAIYGKGVHVLTFNDYLAKRDAEWMEPVYNFLGLSVGVVQENSSPEERRKAYQCDITYATAKQVGFDYLRSFIAYEREEVILRELNYVIIDEADAILIDEARNPLVLAGQISSPKISGKEIAQIVKTLKQGEAFELDEYGRNIFLTENGLAFMQEQLAIEDLFTEENKKILTAINLALHARMLLHKDEDYIVQNGQILLVDEFTGRIVEDRKWPGGLQAALEAKEALDIQSEGSILGSISLQHFIQQYQKIAGMTATAQAAFEEFRDLYGLDILAIPPNKKNIRKDFTDLIFTHQAVKTTALISEVKRIHQKGQPILIGTLTVKESETLGKRFEQEGLPCRILNARNNQLEAEIIAEAGQLGAITISTNMAGRGTDIRLGGSEGESHDKVVALGGLHVIGTNRHESDRIDLQLRGRAGRQGDPGSSQFILSLDDPLMKRYKLKEVLPEAFKEAHQQEAIQSKIVHRRVDLGQRTIKAQMHYIRRTLFDYTDFVEKQRLIFQSRRQEFLFNNQQLDQNIRMHILNQADQLWMKHLEYISQLREGIHFVRLGGQVPIRIFHQQSDHHFAAIQSDFDSFISKLKSGEISLQQNRIKRPSSTWTYIVNDNPFGNQLATMLLGNGNIGFQIDFITLPILFFIGLFKKMRFWKK